MRHIVLLSMNAFFVLLSSPCVAAIITGYDVSGSLDGREVSVAPSIVAANVTGSPLARGPGLAIRGGASTANAGTFTSVGFNGEPTDYVSFGFVVDPGFVVSLENLLIGIGGSLGAPNQYSIFYSGDSFASPLGVVDIPFEFAENVQSVIDLSSLSNLQGAVEFRIFATSTIPIDQSDLGISAAARMIVGNYFSAPDVDSGSFGFNGTVSAVPEPSSLAFLAASVFGVIGKRMRRWKVSS